MTDYLFKRFVRTIFVLLILSIAVFLILSMAGDPATIMLPPDATAEDVVTLRRALGLDQPLYIQYFYYISHMIRGDFGNSWQYNLPALDLVLERFPATFQLALSALLLALVVGIPVGIFAALNEGSFGDLVSISIGVVGRAMPSFWLGLMLILLFAVQLGWLPTSGRGTFRNLILPTVTLSTAFLAQIVLLVRSGMLEVMREDYIRTARAKGLHDYLVNYRHAFRNTLIPVVTMVGLTFGRLLGGSVITETVFSWPGVGRLAVQAVSARDFPLVQASVVVLSIWIVLANLLVDLLYAFLDPRIRYGTK